MFERLFAKRGLSLERMRVLLELREAGSIVKAAGSDPVRQSQFSRQLKELGEYFGVELTERKGRNLTLTPAGQELAILIKEHFVALGHYARRMEDEPVPVFIGAGESFIHWLLVPMAHELQNAVPGITLRFLNLTSADVATRLLDRDIDFGILRRDAAPASLQTHSLGKGTFYLYASRDLIQGMKSPKDKTLLSRLPLALMPGDTSFIKKLYQLAERQKVRLNVQLECDSFTAMVKAVITGKYAAILPGLARQELSESIQSVDLSMLNPLVADMCVAWQKRKIGIRPELERVGEWLTRHATEYMT